MKIITIAEAINRDLIIKGANKPIPLEELFKPLTKPHEKSTDNQVERKHRVRKGI